MFSFQGQVVWITGSSTGIGRAAALSFADQGADVVIHCLHSVKEAESLVAEIEAKGRQCLLVLGDVAKRDDVERMADQIKQRFGRIDVLVNNAGSMVQRIKIEEMDEATWDRVMDVNFKSVFLVTQAVLPFMKEQKKGKIINVSSVAARSGGGIGGVAYAAAKGGVSTLTRGLAKELVSYSILVNGIAPGVISTPFHDRFSTAEMRRNMASQIPLGREGTPEETVGAILFLASTHADYITGEIIEVNGGQLMN